MNEGRKVRESVSEGLNELARNEGMNGQVSIPEHCCFSAPEAPPSSAGPPAPRVWAGSWAGWLSVHPQPLVTETTDLTLVFHPHRAPFLHL